MAGEDLPAWAITPVPDADLAFVQSWEAAATWADCEQAIGDHGPEFPGPTLARSLDVLAFLHPSAARLPTDDTRAVVTHSATAIDRALDAIEGNDFEVLPIIIQARPDILGVPGTGPFLLAIYALANDDGDQALGAISAAADSSTDVQRRAHLIRLRHLADDPAGIPGGAAAVHPLIVALESLASPAPAEGADPARATDPPNEPVQ